MISLHCPVNFVSYGIVGKNILKSLSLLDNIALFPIGEVNGIENEQEKQTIIRAIDNSLSHDTGCPCIKIWHQHDLYSMPKCSERIGFPIFELNQLNIREKSSLLSCDKIFVCSKWAQDIVSDQLHRQSIVVPLGVDTSVFYPKHEASSETFQILNVSKIEIRKGHDIIPEIIKRAFPDGNENYTLIMSWDNPFMTAAETAEWQNFYRKNVKRVLFPQRMSINQMADMMSEANVVLSPSRAEGWNLSLLEAMACGTHIITTNYSGHTEFCNKDNSSLINISGMEIADDAKWFTSGIGEWAIPDIDHAAELLRAKYEDWVKNGPTLNQSGIETAKKFTWDNTAKTIMGAI